ncbi:MAG: AAA family ATPase, partial [Halobacteriota archaeon]
MSDGSDAAPFDSLTEATLRERFDRTDYVADDRTVTTVFLALGLGRPLLVEGPPGSGKTELGKSLAAGFDTELIRLQCYEGLTAENALYEWNYTKQLLAVQADEGTVTGAASTPPGAASEGGSNADRPDSHKRSAGDDPDRSASVFGEEYLLERPLLRALRTGGDHPPVLL